MTWAFDNTYARQLPWLGVAMRPTPVREPRLLALNDDLAAQLGLDPAKLRSNAGADIFAGNLVPEGAEPLCQAYAGHQFGSFSPMLGDGRAHLLGEVVDVHGRRRDIALKGSGRTPFSRAGDGRAALGPVLREFVVAESMHALGIPTTRALAAAATGELVWRDRPLPGAVLTRVASSHLRVGTVELVRTRGSVEQLGELLEYIRCRHDSDLEPGDALGVLAGVIGRQADLVAAWMSVGFIHGVMNTDNMTLSGETIDYGPCAFLDGYDPDTAFSSIDVQGRYRYRAQPVIASWNLARLAEALLPLIDADPDTAVASATECVETFEARYESARRRRFGAKLGLPTGVSDANLIDDLLALMSEDRLDFTSTFRALAQWLRGERDLVRSLVSDPSAYDAWEQRWRVMLGDRDLRVVAAAMDAVNPVYLPRNHLVEEALAAAESGDLDPFESLLDAVRSPFHERSGMQRYAAPGEAGFTAGYQTFCGT